MDLTVRLVEFSNMNFPKAIRFVIATLLLALSILPADAETSPAFPNVAMPVIPKHIVSLVDFGGSGDGKKLNTSTFEKAFAALADQGGGQLIVPPGIWLTGPIKLRSNINLHLERGALIQFSGDWKLYPLTVIDLNGEQEIDSTSPISGEKLENIAITVTRCHASTKRRAALIGYELGSRRHSHSYNRSTECCVH